MGSALASYIDRPFAAVGVANALKGIPASVWLLVLVAAWILFGLVGHDPWKADEAYTFGVVIDHLRNGNWVVPTLAGEPFVEKPPLFYLAAAASAYLFGGLLPLHDAARLATGFFAATTLLFLGLTARELYGRGYAATTVLMFISCLGTFVHLHQLITDVALLAGLAIGIYGLALSRRTIWGASIALGTGAACAFLAKGLLGPGLLAVTAVVLPTLAQWRSRRYLKVLALSALIAFPPAAFWMFALYARSPDLFYEWFVTNNFGRFLGFTDIGPHNRPGFYAYTLLWYALPALPLSGFALWTAWRQPEYGCARRELQLPIVFAAVTASVLGIASDSRELYLLPLMLPLSLLAARAIPWLPARGAMAMSRGARFGMGLTALAIWLGWLALVTGIPPQLQSWLLAYQPGFEPRIPWIHVSLAVAVTLAAGLVLARPTESSRRALTQWAVGLTLCWALLATLWVPYLDVGKSYRSMINSLAAQLPGSGCVSSLDLGEPQRGLLVYYAEVRTVRLESVPEAECKSLLVQGWHDTGAPPPMADWVAVWEGARPGDHKEFYRLYRRDVAPGHAVVQFPP